LTGDVSRGILTLTEGEKMFRIEKAWFGEPDACLRQSSADIGPYSSNLKFKSFGGLFLLTGVASGLMLLVYIATFAYSERDELRAAGGTAESGSVPLSKLRAWLQHYDTKDLRSPTFKMHSEESPRNGCEAANRTPRWIGESSTSGGTSPFSVRASSEMNAASSPEDDNLGNSIEQGVQEASTSVTVEMASPTPSQLHVCTSR
jgi:hypothetical protein